MKEKGIAIIAAFLISMLLFIGSGSIEYRYEEYQTYIIKVDNDIYEIEGYFIRGKTEGILSPVLYIVTVYDANFNTIFQACSRVEIIYYVKKEEKLWIKKN